MKPSISGSSARRNASTTRCASAAFSASGFSHSTGLAGVGGRDRPFGMQAVRQRDVDGVDVGRSEQRLIGGEASLMPKSPANSARARGIAAGNRDDAAVRRRLDRRHDLRARYAGGAKHAPAEH